MLKLNRFFLLGKHEHNAGPSNVNRSLIEHSDGAMLYQSYRGRGSGAINYLRFMLCKTVLCGTPAGISLGQIKYCHFFGTKVAYMMHSCLAYENVINHLNLQKQTIEREDAILHSVDKIICVSERFSEWVIARYPELKDNVTYVNNGVSISPRPKVEKKPYTIAVAGGNRAIKNNDVVCDAVSKLIELGHECEVYVFGRMYPNNSDLTKYPFVKVMGQMDKEEYYRKLDTISLFVLNSTLESFGLVTADALNCNCSLLMSQTVGAISILQTKESDIIFDTNDIETLAAKILFLLKNGNADRLLSKIDIEDCSEASAYKKIKQKCLQG